MNPNTFSLNQNYPNPFNPSTNIGFEIFQAVDVEITVYDVNGRFINTLIKGYMNAGNHSITWDGVSSSGKPVSAGIYLYSITAGKNTAIKKMSFIK
jgi:flagellar hook assembly protein FlgD